MSERNHVRWRLANATFRRASCRSPRRASARHRGPPRPRDSRWRRTPAAPSHTAREAPRASSTRPASNWRRARTAIRRACSARSTTSRPSDATGPGYPRGDGSGPSPLERRDLQRADDAPRVAKVGPRGEGRGSRRQPSGKRVHAVAFELGLEGRPHRRVRWQRVRIEARRRPPAARTPCRRRGSRCRPVGRGPRARPRRASGTPPR